MTDIDTASVKTPLYRSGDAIYDADGRLFALACWFNNTTCDHAQLIADAVNDYVVKLRAEGMSQP